MLYNTKKTQTQSQKHTTTCVHNVKYTIGMVPVAMVDGGGASVGGECRLQKSASLQHRTAFR